jgi:hypothetical protein
LRLNNTIYNRNKNKIIESINNNNILFILHKRCNPLEALLHYLLCLLKALSCEGGICHQPTQLELIVVIIKCVVDEGEEVGQTVVLYSGQ